MNFADGFVVLEVESGIAIRERFRSRMKSRWLLANKKPSRRGCNVGVKEIVYLWKQENLLGRVLGSVFHIVSSVSDGVANIV